MVSWRAEGYDIKKCNMVERDKKRSEYEAREAMKVVEEEK